MAISEGAGRLSCRFGGVKPPMLVELWIFPFALGLSKPVLSLPKGVNG